jgi:hypothetical protein
LASACTTSRRTPAGEKNQSSTSDAESMRVTADAAFCSAIVAGGASESEDAMTISMPAMLASLRSVSASPW